MAGHARLADPPLPDGLTARVVWNYVYDNIPTEYGGGFVSGTFMVRSDGAILCRHGDTWYIDSMVDPAFSIEAVADILRGRSYDLYIAGARDEREMAIPYTGTARNAAAQPPGRQEVRRPGAR